VEKSNVIFIDIDGPLLPARQWYAPENAQVLREIGGDVSKILFDFELKKRLRFDPVAVAMFNVWIEFSKAKCVFSTNWKMHTSAIELLELCLINGMNVELHSDPVTPSKFTPLRSHEINLWLSDNSESINNYIVVDDDYSMSPDILRSCPGPLADIAENVVFVDYYNGISTRNFHDACQILGIKKRKVDERLFGKP